MPRAQALEAMAKRGWSPVSGGDRVSIQAKGRLDFRGIASCEHLVFEGWEVELVFSHGVQDRALFSVDEVRGQPFGT